MVTEIGIGMAFGPAVQGRRQRLSVPASCWQVLLQDEHQDQLTLGGEVRHVLGDDSPALLAPLPIGFFIRNRMAAYLAYVALHSFVFTFQSTTLLKEWNGGDYSAFVKNPAAVDWSYGLVNLLVFAAGLGLVTLGSWLRARRRRPAPSAAPASLAK